jgi:HK97 gp10 family phage protein
MRLNVQIHTPKALQKAPERMKAGIRQGIARSTSILTNAAIEKAPRRYGTLRRSIVSTPMEELGRLVLGKVIQDETVAHYGKFVEYGTGIYGPKGQPIRPRTAKVLAWKDKSAPKGMRFARSVKGMRPRPYMHPAFEENKDKVKAVLQEEIIKAIQGGG